MKGGRFTGAYHRMKVLLQTLKNIPARAVRASAYSWAGLKSAFVREEAFRLETLVLGLLVLVLIFIPWPLWKKFAMTAVYFLIPLTELLNSAIEDLGDLASRDFNLHVKNAKDKGSAAVLLAIFVNLLAGAALILV